VRGADRAQAEDIAAAVTLELEELPAVYDMRKARDDDSALVHEHWAITSFSKARSKSISQRRWTRRSR